MDIEIVQQLLAMVSKAGEGAFWLVIVYFVMEYISPVIGWLGALTIIGLIIRCVAHALERSADSSDIKMLAEAAGMQWHLDKNHTYNLHYMRQHLRELRRVYIENME